MAPVMTRLKTQKYRAILMGSALVVLSACDEPLDFDLRSVGNGFDTTAAVQNIDARPSPDSRGVISYPNYQVAVAERGDTMRDVAARLGLDPIELARYNAVSPDVTLRRGEIIALPVRVSEPSPATGAVFTGPIQPPSVDVTELASTAIDNAEAQIEPQAVPVAPPIAPTALPQTGREPIRHQVERGETAYSVARIYNVPVRNLAEWNGLGADLMVREGQFLLIPVTSETPLATSTETTLPGTGTVTPLPPSAANPLPDEDLAIALPDAETIAPDLGADLSVTGSSGRFLMPADGNIIRAYARGRNEGIDIGAPAGATVRAADAGQVAAVTQNTNGVTILVIKHADDLLTVYTNIEDLTVAQGDTVARGQSVGVVRAGSPSFVHFEVRRGIESVDPQPFLN